MVVVGALALLVLAGLVLSARAHDPCPPQAVFLYSAAHNSDFCACLGEFTCTGSGCTLGNAANVPAFGDGIEGFPATCLDCLCVPTALKSKGLSYESMLTSVLDSKHDVTVKQYAQGVVMREFRDILYAEHCSPFVDSSSHETTPAPKALRHLHWVHIPNAGDNMGAVLYHYACRNAHSRPSGYTGSCDSCNYFCGDRCQGFHAETVGLSGLHPPGSTLSSAKACLATFGGEIVDMGTEKAYSQFHPDVERGTAVTVLSQPLRRSLAVFNTGKFVPHMRMDEQDRLQLVSRSLESFAVFPGVSGVQTKMLVGTRPGKHVPRLEHMVPIAKEALEEELAFFGIHERWMESVCLFHTMFGGRIQSDEISSDPILATPASSSRRSPPMHGDDGVEQGGQANYHEDKYEPFRQTKQLDDPLPADEWRKLRDLHDTHDCTLYGEAVKVFNERLRLYGLKEISGNDLSC